MKQILFMMLAGSLLIGTSCKEQEDGSTEMMSADEVADKTQEVAVDVAEKAEEVTEQTEAAVNALTVKSEDVMADLNQSMEQIKDKVAGFDKTQLLAYVEQYKTILMEQKDQIAALTEQVKGLNVTELMGDKATAFKEQLGTYTEQFNGLQERYSVYLDALKGYGVDLSAYTL